MAGGWPRRPSPAALALVVTALAAPLATGAGGLTQPPAGCVVDGPAAGRCAPGRALARPTGLAVSPDGRNLYVAAEGSSALAVFRRDPSGRLAQLDGPAGCLSSAGAPGCTTAPGLGGAVAVAVSPDGHSVYAAAYGDGAVAAFRRNPVSGHLMPLPGAGACLSSAGAPECRPGRALGGARSLAVSSDGRSVYVASMLGGAVAVLERDPRTGVLTQPAGPAGCLADAGAGGCATGHGLAGLTSVALAPDGHRVYVTSFTNDLVAVLDRDPHTGRLSQDRGADSCVQERDAPDCEAGVGLIGAFGVAVSPDGANVYVVSAKDGAIATFSSAAAGRLVQVGSANYACLSAAGQSAGQPGICGVAAGLEGARGVAVSPDGAHVEVAGQAASAVATFDRSVTSGGILVQPAGAAGCVAAGGRGGSECAGADGLAGAVAVAESPDGATVYVAARDADVVAVLSRAAGLVPAVGAAAVTLRDPAGDTPVRSLDLIGAAVFLRQGSLVVELRLAAPAGRDGQYAAVVRGAGGRVWEVAATRRHGVASFRAFQLNGSRQLAIQGLIRGRAVRIVAPAAPLGAAGGRFSFSVLSQPAAGRPSGADRAPADGWPGPGGVPFRRG